MKYISDAPLAPKAIGPYSQAVDTGSLVFISGQIPIDPATGKLVEGEVEAQTERVMENLRGILSHLALDFSAVVKTTIYLTDLGSFRAVNAIYEKWMGGFRPARATVQVAALPLGAQIEIELIAMHSKKR